jgi:hypothetical protein
VPSVGAFEAMTHLAAQLDAVSAGEQITIARLRQFNQGQSLGGISIAELPCTAQNWQVVAIREVSLHNDLRLHQLSQDRKGCRHGPDHRPLAPRLRVSRR